MWSIGSPSSPSTRRSAAASCTVAALLGGLLLVMLLASTALAAAPAGFMAAQSATLVLPGNPLALQKAVNGVDADTLPGLYLRAGDPVTWTFAVSVSAPITLANISVTDSMSGVTPVYAGGDGNGDAILDPGEQWLFQAVGIAGTGQYTNLGQATGVKPSGDFMTATDAAHYYGVVPSAIAVEKIASAAYVTRTTTVTYAYIVSNAGVEPLHAISVTDDLCAPVVYDNGDTGTDGILAIGEGWTYFCTAEIQYATRNTAIATGVDLLGETVQAAATVFVDSTGMFFPALFAYTPPIACLPPDGCALAGRIKGMDVHEGSGALYVTAREVVGAQDQLLKVDTDTFQIVAHAQTGSQPWGVVVNETTNRVYVSNFESGDVRIYDADTLALLVPPITVGGKPGRMALLEALDTVFVTVRGNSQIAVIQGLGPAQLVDAGGSGPWGIAADPVRNYVYVSHTDSASFSLLRRVNGEWTAQPATDRLEDRTRLFGLAYNPANNKLYAPYADKKGNWFVEIWEPHADSPWGRVTHTPVPSGGALDDANVGGDGIVVNPATGNVFNANTGAGSVSILDPVSNGVRGAVAVQDDPFPAAVDSTRHTVYIGLRAPGAW